MERTAKMFRYNSYPVVTKKAQTPVKAYDSKAEIFLLPDRVLETIFSNLPYTELVKLRYVCRWFYYVIGSMLNRKFFSLHATIDEEIIFTKRRRKKTASDGYLRILYIIKSEVKILEANCLDYIIGNMFFFYGGMIFDCIDELVALKNCKDCSVAISRLFVLIDNFLDHFDTTIEPEIVKRSMHLSYSWFGKKIADTLDCYTNFEYQITMNPNTGNNCCSINGLYDASDIMSVSEPPFLINSVTSVNMDLFKVLKYIRNHIRWNNVLNYITIADSKLENFCTEMWCQTTSDSKVVYNKRVKRMSNVANRQSFVISLELYCHKVLAPLKCREKLGNVYTVDSCKKMAGGESDVVSEAIPLKVGDYELNLSLDATYKDKSDPERYRMTTIQVCQVDNSCYLASCVSDDLPPE